MSSRNSYPLETKSGTLVLQEMAKWRLVELFYLITLVPIIGNDIHLDSRLISKIALELNYTVYSVQSSMHMHGYCVSAVFGFC